MVNDKHRPLIAAEPITFSLMKKYQKIKSEKTFRPRGQTPWPGFPAGLCPLLLVFLFDVNALIKHRRQQISFGRNQVKAMMDWRLRGIQHLQKHGYERLRATVAAQVLPDLQRKAQCGKEASLLT